MFSDSGSKNFDELQKKNEEQVNIFKNLFR